ncbi:unnamed protein product, partial [Phaeothamnion confervicola]
LLSVLLLVGSFAAFHAINKPNLEDGEMSNSNAGCRIVTWNVNGLRSVSAEGGGLPSLLASLDAEIICFQETKVVRSALGPELALSPGYHLYFTFCRLQNKRHYSGVLTAVRRHDNVQGPKPASSAAAGGTVATAAGATSAPSPAVAAATDSADVASAATASADNSSNDPKPSTPAQSSRRARSCAVGTAAATTRLGDDVFFGCPLPPVLDGPRVAELDAEGRMVATDHGSFVLLNVYSPCLSKDSEDASMSEWERQQVRLRRHFKADFTAALTIRCRQLMVAGREVVLVGDLNACATTMDCSYRISEVELASSLWSRWLRRLLGMKVGDAAGGQPWQPQQPLQPQPQQMLP